MEWIAHRGAAFEAPENSFEAFELAIDQGAQRIELDVQLTADGVPVVCHDLDTGRITARRLEISNTTWAELSELRLENGEPIPSLEQTCEVVSGRCALNVELKTSQPELVRKVVELLGSFDMVSETLISSFDPKPLRQLKQERFGGRIGLLIGTESYNPLHRAYEAWPFRTLKVVGATDLVCHHRIAHRMLRAVLRWKGIGLVLWATMADERQPPEVRRELYLRAAALSPAGVIVGRVSEAKAVIAGRRP